MPDEPIEHELLRNAVAAEVTVTNTEVSPTSTGDRHLGLLRAAPPVPAPLVPRNATEVGERRCGRESLWQGYGGASRAGVDHDEDGVGDVVLRDSDAAAAASSDDMRRAPAECLQCHGGGAPILRPQAEPCGDESGGRTRVFVPHPVDALSAVSRQARVASAPRARD